MQGYTERIQCICDLLQDIILIMYINEVFTHNHWHTWKILFEDRICAGRTESLAYAQENSCYQERPAPCRVHQHVRESVPAGTHAHIKVCLHEA